jgi:dienelactone hydrolase
MTKQPTTLEIPTGDDHPVWADLYLATGRRAGGRSGGLVILCHGMKGYRRWGFIPRLAESLSGVGLAALAIDFSHNGAAGGDGGKSGGPVYPHPELLRKNTLDRERRDLAAAIRWARAGGDGCAGLDTRIGLWGHSRGGTSVLLNALDDPAGIAAVATWSAVAHADIYTPRQKERWRDTGEYDWLETDSGEHLAMGVCFLDDLEERGEEYSLAERSADLAVPHLIVHGEIDLVIPVANAHRFAAAPARAEKKLVLLRAGHTYGIGRSPDPEPLRRAIEITVDWFRRYLMKQGDDE